MFAEPRQTRFDGSRLKLGSDHARWYSGVVNPDDRRQVSLNSIADGHFVRNTVSHCQRQVRQCGQLPVLMAYVSYWGFAQRLVDSSARVSDWAARSVPDW